MAQELEITPPPAVAARGLVTIGWHGDFGGRHSLALVNDRLTAELARIAGLSIERRPAGSANAAPAGGDAASGVDVTHGWPPRLAPPSSSRRWIVFQPWEFGSMPSSWLAPFRDQADDVWVYSAFNRRAYVADGLAADRVAVIPLGVDSEMFHPDAPPSSRILRGTTKKFRFLFVGGTIHRKGIDVLLQAWRRAFRRSDDVCLVVKDFCRKTAYAGQTNEDLVRRIAADPDAGEVLYVTEDLDPRELPGIYAACQVLVHPYRGEGFGLPVAEAMASARPVIVTRGGPCDEFCPPTAGIFVTAARRELTWSHDLVGKGFLLEPSAEELAAMMRLAFAHQDRMRDMGARGRETAIARLSWKETARAAAERIAAVLSRPPRSSRAPGPGPERPASWESRTTT
jgi:glycosyltransferase involved in cell wall biosynthesis